MHYEYLTVDREPGVALVTLNRPDKYNALNAGLMSELERLTQEIHADVETRAVVFTGAGKHFSAGADLADVKARMTGDTSLLTRRRFLQQGPRVVRRVFAMEQISIAAINGGALGGAACIASACDFRIGVEGGFVSYPEIHLGMNLSWGGLPLLVRLVGPSRAKRMVILGERENAATLKEWGFLDEVVPPGELVERAMAMARKYAERPPVQAQMIKRSVNMIASAVDQAVMHMDTDQFLLSSGTADHMEGVRAYFEKRPPKFEGR